MPANAAVIARCPEEGSLVVKNSSTVPKRITAAIFSSLQAGVTPRLGLDHLLVGRTAEVTALLNDLESVADGGAAFRVITGPYGSGKSFLLQLTREYAISRGFVVADVDLSPDRRLTGTGGKGTATYREMLGNLSTKTRPGGGALKPMLEKWLSEIQQAVVSAGVSHQDSAFQQEVDKRIRAVVDQLQTLVHGFDFASVISAYHRGYLSEDETLQANAVRWLRAEYTSKMDAKRDLGVRVIIDDDTWFDYLKLFAEFVRTLGYRGLVVIIDEAVNLYKLTNSVARNNNYEKLLTILNDALQGRASHLAVLVGGTPKSVTDPNRGLYSYEALRSRLQTSAYSAVGMRDMNTPVVMLDPLTDTETFALLRRVLALHGMHYGYEPAVEEAHLIEFMKKQREALGSSEYSTPRATLRNFVSALNISQQYEGKTFLGVIRGSDFVLTPDDSQQRAVEEDSVTTVEESIERAARTPQGFADFEL
jgi:hypothetical protein